MRRYAVRLLGALVFLLALAAPLRAQEVSAVTVGGEPVFSVAALPNLGAAARASAISDSLAARLKSDAPVAPIQVVATDSAALLMIGSDTLMHVTPGDAEVASARPLSPEQARQMTVSVAKDWRNALATVLSRAVAGETAPVVVQGRPIFKVSGTSELRAKRRAAAIGLRIAQLAASRVPLPALRLKGHNRVSILAGRDTILTVTPAEAELFDTTAQELARSRLQEIESTVHGLRAQGTIGFWLRLLLQIILVLAIAGAAHLGLRALKRRAPHRPHTSLGRAVLAWAASLAQFVLWVLVAVSILWLVPTTSSITFELWHRWLAAVGTAAGWFRDNGLGIAFILVVAYFGARIVGAVVRQSVLTFGARQGGRTQLRASTLAGTLAGGAQVLVLFLGLVGLLALLDIDPLPLLASAGVAGIALGFGVQSLIRDFFSGIFILLEDQYGVGDVIKVSDVSGTVERFTLRITQLRSLDGSFTSIPNGEITKVTNLTKDWSQAVLDVNIALGENVDRAVDVIQAAAAGLKEEWKERIRGEPQVLGVETVDPLAQAITIRVVVRTAPLERAAVSRELRRRILDAFLEAKIQVPPRAVVTLPGQSPPQS